MPSKSAAQSTVAKKIDAKMQLQAQPSKNGPPRVSTQIVDLEWLRGLGFGHKTTPFRITVKSRLRFWDCKA
jgi:hypothetical protein